MDSAQSQMLCQTCMPGVATVLSRHWHGRCSFQWAMLSEHGQSEAVDPARLGEVTFRLCRLMLARKVLWDEDLGLDLQQLADALQSPPEVVQRAVAALDAEGWIELDGGGDRPVLTAAGITAIRGGSSL